jgi:hypothetical protein
MHADAGELLFERGLVPAKRGPDLGDQSLDLPVLVTGRLPLGEQAADFLRPLGRTAQVERPLPAALMKRHSEVGAIAPSATVAPRFHHGPLRGEKCWTGKHIGSRLFEPGGLALVNGFRFFHH